MSSYDERNEHSEPEREWDLADVRGVAGARGARAGDPRKAVNFCYLLPWTEEMQTPLRAKGT